MDNGHRGIVINPTSDFQHDASFFTPGVGDAPAENNDYKPEDNLDEENWQKALDISKPAGMPNPTKIAETTGGVEAKTGAGEHAATPERSTDIPKLPDFKLPEAGETKLGQIATIENSISMPEVKKQKSYNPDNLHIIGDRLEKTSIAEIDNEFAKLNQTRDMNSFYDDYLNMREDAVNNSFKDNPYRNSAGGNK